VRVEEVEGEEVHHGSVWVCAWVYQITNANKDEPFSSALTRRASIA
jgi:hypothetical protein